MTNTTATIAALPAAGEKITVVNTVTVGNTVVNTIGIGDHITIPPNFRYAEVFRRGRPQHGIPGKLGTYDSFYVKHPPMDCSRRAKIFAPFNALKGFDEAIEGKEVLYCERRNLTDGERENLDQKMSKLAHLTRNGRVARENRVAVSITYFSPCADIHSEWYSENGRFGQYKTVEGVVLKVDTVQRRIILTAAEEEIPIPVDDIVDIQRKVFRGLHLENA